MTCSYRAWNSTVRVAADEAESLEQPAAALCCCTMIKEGRLRDRNRPLTWEPPYGIEP
jgi:hypothetical protein